MSGPANNDRSAIDLAPISNSDNENDEPIVLKPNEHADIAYAIAPDASERACQSLAEYRWIIATGDPLGQKAKDAGAISASEGA
jgi:hypothetical protein